MPSRSRSREAAATPPRVKKEPLSGDEEERRERRKENRRDRERPGGRDREERESSRSHRKKSPARQPSESRVKREKRSLTPPRRRKEERPARYLPPKTEPGRQPERYENRDRRRDEEERAFNTEKRVANFQKRKRRAEEGDSSQFEWGKPGQAEEKAEEEAVEKEKPDFGTSGKLAEDTNKFNGVVVSYNEPADARKPRLRWRLYPFKEDEALPVLYVHRQSAYLVGRDRRVVDIPVDHPSCSKQHAALQYRLVGVDRADGSRGKEIRPYVMDLASANGTFLNNNKVEAQRYYELKERDVLKFGFSSREYVVLNERSEGAEDDEPPSPSEDKDSQD